jgi:hypothetical protein
MKPFEIYIVSISWGSSGKSRPALVYALGTDVVKIYPITTQYENKSEAIKMRYFKINDWSEAGLDKQSYVDTGTRLKQTLSMFDNLRPIGELSVADKKRLLDFLNKQRS